MRGVRIYFLVISTYCHFIAAIVNPESGYTFSNKNFSQIITSFQKTRNPEAVIFPSPKRPSTLKNTCGLLRAPQNSAVVCVDTECRVTCSKGFLTENKETVSVYVCKNNVWVDKSRNTSVIGQCFASCDPPCLNGGECVMPNVCQCPRPYSGAYCEARKVLCPTLPPTPLFSAVECDPEKCTISCLAGKRFPDGSTIVNLFCIDSNWVPANTKWSSMPDCIPECNPNCLHGGKCIDTNVCLCPENYRGDICQYSIDVCDVSKLNFNGNYNCSGDDQKFSCQLTCPPGMKSSEPFESSYSCLYSDGFFTPVNIPQCQAQTDATVWEFSKTVTTTTTETTCMFWGSHLKSFNENVLSFKSNCGFTLVEDKLQSLFSVQMFLREGIIAKIVIYINNVVYVLRQSDEGKPVFEIGSNGQKLSIPSQLTDLKVEIASGKSVAVYIPATNLYLVWNLKDELQIDVSGEFSKRTAGLCGRGSSNSVSDVHSYISDFVVTSIGEQCDQPLEKDDDCSPEDEEAATKLCSRLKTDTIFKNFQKVMPVSEYVTACKWGYCNCMKNDKQECLCQFISKFVQRASQLTKGLKVDWRDQFNCSIKCPAGQMYTSCLPVSIATCAVEDSKPTVLQRYCEGGCQCADGTVFHEGKCIKRETCYCLFGGRFYKPNSVVLKDCNKCTCIGGKWSCTEDICKAECLVFGDPHYRTFDGKKYDFSGTCSYKLVVTDDAVIEIVNAGYRKSLRSKSPVTLKSIVITVGETIISLNELSAIRINDRELQTLPTMIDGKIYIRKASSFLVQVLLPNGLEVTWNGKNKLQIFANSTLFDKTKGLCGTFNNNQGDDLLTPEGDVEKDVLAFANKWRSNEKCEVEKVYDGTNACEINFHNKEIAQNHCSNLTGALFKDCHSLIDPTTYYEDCLNDVCACQENSITECFCPIVSAYAQECSRIGVPIDWRDEIRICGIHCPLGQKYEVCGSSCQRSCSDLSHGEMCRSSCVEGCYCPSGFTFNHREECIPISECPCLYNGQKFSSGFIDIRNGSQAWECKNAVWEFKIATEIEISRYRNKTSCPENMVYAECEPPEPVTCRNMHNPPQYSEKSCLRGCVCKEGYVLESVSKRCIKPIDCPCHHGGRSYSDGETMQEDCNTCVCSKGKWNCTERECDAVCSSWGDSHFRTFDGRFYDFQGTCDYVLAKGQFSATKTFSISIEIVPCGTGGTSCMKSVTVSVGSVGDSETVTFEKEKLNEIDKSFKQFDVIITTLHVVVILKGYSVSLYWDKGTRINLRANSKWKNKLSGLCGNYNGNALDDFQTPSGGLIEVSPSIFADAWKLQHHCPFPRQIQDPCTLHPYRKFWSVKKCSYLKESPVFKKCHSEVPVDDYFRRCVFDSCACDEGGDCECLCTSFSAYAQECSNKGVSVKWRRHDLCPMQCEFGKKYSPCISSCPKKHCGNWYNSVFSQCQSLPCVEGCEEPICFDKKVFHNSSSEECTEPNNCECLTINGKTYRENDLIFSDKCHSCYCSQGRQVCTGEQCHDEETCQQGWSPWLTIRKNFAGILDKSHLKLENTYETLPCPSFSRKDIRCRSRSSSFDWQSVKCEFGKKVRCKENCTEFQIQVNCDCDKVNEPTNKPFKCEATCDRMCQYFKNRLGNVCSLSHGCAANFVNVNCPPGKMWRDKKTCVSLDACTCMSRNGTRIKPSTYVRENDCSLCQCLNGEYVCTPPACPTTRTIPPYSTTTRRTTETMETIVPPVFIPLLPECPLSNLIPIDQEAKYRDNNGILNMTYAKGVELELVTTTKKPLLEKIKNFFWKKTENEGTQKKRNGLWRPGKADTGQFLEIDLGVRKPIYGVITTGNPDADEFVQSFHVLYSNDGHVYHYAKCFAGTNILRGTYDHSMPERQLFNKAVEGRFVRIKPILWNKWISMQIRVLGCAPAVSTEKPIIRCSQPMGIENGKMNPEQISVSSSLNHDFNPADISLSSDKAGWSPFLASKDQWIEFDFLKDRIIEGIITKGSATDSLGESWVEAYLIKYRSDESNWNSIIDENGHEKIYAANYNGYDAQTNIFDIPLRTRYLRIYPVKWNHFPALKVEILGCFEAYGPIPSRPPKPGLLLWKNVCRGLEAENASCVNETYWNGTECVGKELCPCVAESMIYPVGSVYLLKDHCVKCTCTIGGTSTCRSNEEDCPPCSEQGLLRVTTTDCGCQCVPCPPGTILCKTSNICLNKSLWCNGYKECPDDETDCEFSTPSIIASTVTYEMTTQPVPEHICPEPTCPEGYTPVIKNQAQKQQEVSLMQALRKDTFKSKTFNKSVQFSKNTEFSGDAKTVVTTITIVKIKRITKNVTGYTNLQKEQEKKIENVVCQDWSCEPIIGTACAEKPQCPVGTKIQSKWTGKPCPEYECYALPPLEKECHVNGRLITTFDGLSFNYDICDHVLAEDKMFGTWKIRKIKKCTFVGNCVELLKIYHYVDVIELSHNFSVWYNGYKYTIDQLQTIGSRTELFVVKSLSTKFVIFASLNLKFSVVWGHTGVVKIIIDSSLHGMIDGLCGYFDFNTENDKQKPDGTVVTSTQEFGDSWKQSNETCQTKACTTEMHKKAAEICGVFKQEPFHVCDFTMNVEDYIAQCIELLCTCSASADNFDKDCRCPMLQYFAGKCSNLQPGTDLSSWRMKYDCAVNCTAPFVYYECYDRHCEPDCSSLLEKDQCPVIKGRCFPGCYCPAGLIRKDNTCIKPAQCRNCICSINSALQLTTFDQVQVPFDASCTSSVLLETKNSELLESNVKIVVTRAQCVNSYLKNSICPHILTVFIDKQKILLYQSETDANAISVEIDGGQIPTFPYDDGTIKITESRGISITLSILSVQLDVTLFTNDKGLLVQLPSYLYSTNTKGLCGTCNRNQVDDIRTPSGEETNNFDKFLSSWRIKSFADTKRWKCNPLPPNECDKPSPNEACKLLLDEQIFGKCHSIVDPQSYVELCQSTTCKGISHCQTLATYAQDCQRNGVCIPWRNANLCPYQCPKGFEYRPCSVTCDINCDNYEQFQNEIDACTEPLAEKCVCPEGMVLLNGTCVAEYLCKPCDTFGHYPGDKWMPDKCKTCECSRDRSITCQQTECPAKIICAMGMKTEIDTTNDDPCCVKYVCVKDGRDNCPKPTIIECGKHQRTQLTTTADNCTIYICACIPPEECPKFETDDNVQLLPGMVRRERKQGCCPSTEMECDEKTCPTPKQCPQFYIRAEKKATDACCPEYKCELPHDICVHKYRWIADTNGSERERLPAEEYTELKKVGETWSDGPCRLCSCTNESSFGVCSTIDCGKEPISETYVMKPFIKFGDCCPVYKPVACKVNTVVHEENSTWNVENEPCKTMSCIRGSNGGILVKEIIQSCQKDCEKGWKYFEPANKSACCGSCKQVACVDGAGSVHPPNSVWYSDDNCTKFECDEEFNIMGFGEVCPTIVDCPKELIYIEGCCRKCNMTTRNQVNCNAVTLAPNATIGQIRSQNGAHRDCINKKEIKGLTKCDGQCESYGFYDEDTSKYINACHCCAGIEFTSITATLSCKDGFMFDEKIQVPTKCQCQGCAAKPPESSTTSSKKPSLLGFVIPSV